MSRSSVVLAFSLIASISCNGPDSTPSDSTPGATTEDPARQEGYVQSSDGVRLFYRMLGSGPDTLIVLHGGPSFTMDYFYADLEPLAMRSTLLFYDQRGAGGSTLVADSAALGGDSFVADLESVRRHFGMEKVVLLGHSWGTGVAAMYAQKHTDRVARMVIVGALPLQRSVLVEGFESMQAGRDSVTLSRMAEWQEAREANPGDVTACREYYALWFEAFVPDTSSLRRSKGDFCAGTAESLQNAMTAVGRYTLASLGDWDWRSSLRGVDAPTLIVHGTVDPLPLEGAREWGRALPNARILELDGIGHFPYLETPDAFFATVDRFLQGEWPEGSRTVSN